MRYELLVALRFLRQGRTQTFLIFGGAAMGVGVIVFLTALLSGLQESLIDKTLGSQAHIVARPKDLETRRVYEAQGEERVAARVERPPQRTQWIVEWPKLLRTLERIDGIEAASPVVGGSGFAANGQAQRPVTLLGVLPERHVRIVPFDRKLVRGRFRLGGAEVVIGSGLAADLGLSVGDKLRLTSLEQVTQVFTVSGIFNLGSEPINKRWVLVSLRDGQTMLRIPGGVTSIDLRVREIFEADRLASQITARTDLAADSWMKTNSDLLVGLRGQSNSGVMIAVFVIVAVALGIASVLIVSVVQKSREIGILRATGTTAAMIRRIFLIQGAFTGFFASIAGSLLGAALAKFFESMATNPDGSPIFPVDLRPSLFLAASLVAVLTGLFASLGPAQRAARMDPAVVMRHE